MLPRPSPKRGKKPPACGKTGFKGPPDNKKDWLALWSSLQYSIFFDIVFELFKALWDKGRVGA